MKLARTTIPESVSRLFRFAPTAVIVGCGLAPVLAAQRFGPQETLPGEVVGHAYQRITPGDLDDDGDTDYVVTYAYSRIAWLENPGTPGPCMELHALDGVSAARAGVADLDGDGDLDLIGASHYPDYLLSWYENLDGQGNYGPQRVIANLAAANNLTTHPADLDGDGDQDVLFSSNHQIPRLRWYENLDGQGTFSTAHATTVPFRIVNSYPGDVDGDGDLDVVVDGEDLFGSSLSVWYENTDGLGTFGTMHLITSLLPNTPRGAALGDLDGDADLDVVYAFPGVRWCENLDGLGTFGPLTVIQSGGFYESVDLADLDGDGDLDIVSAYHLFIPVVEGRIVWWENTDGQGSFGTMQVIEATGRKPYHVATADGDGDGDQDVIAALGTEIHW